MNKELFEALKGIESGSGISSEVLIEKIKQGLKNHLERNEVFI